MWAAGHSLIKAKMREENAELGGEMSGHMFFADRFFGYDDAIYAALRLVEILTTSKKTLSELLSDLPPSFSTPEIRIDCPHDKKFEVVAEMQKYFSERYKTITVDGARVIMDGGWGLIRASNTQPALGLRFEAESDERLKEIRDEIEGQLTKIRESLGA